MSKKTKAASEAVPPSFRWKWGKSEIEANGLGLIPAVIAIVMVILVLGLGGVTVHSGFEAFSKWKNADLAQIERPPP